MEQKHCTLTLHKYHSSFLCEKICQILYDTLNVLDLFTYSAVVVFCNYHTRGGRLIIVLSIDIMLVVIEYCQTFNHHISARLIFLLIYTPLLLLLLLLTLHHYYAAFNSFLNSSINEFAVTIHCSRKLWQIKSLLNKETFFQ